MDLVVDLAKLNTLEAAGAPDALACQAQTRVGTRHLGGKMMPFFDGKIARPGTTWYKC
jgi:hypothetical protein